MQSKLSNNVTLPDRVSDKEEGNTKTCRAQTPLTKTKATTTTGTVPMSHHSSGTGPGGGGAHYGKYIFINMKQNADTHTVRYTRRLKI